MKTKLEIIEETIKFYSEDPTRRARSITGGCEYLLRVPGVKDRMCAVGRCMHEPMLYTGSVYSIERLGKRIFDTTFQEALKPEYKGHSRDFWSDLQILHDVKEFWNENGLTNEGKTYADKLRVTYSFAGK